MPVFVGLMASWAMILTWTLPWGSLWRKHLES